MKFSAPREALLDPLQAVIGVVERRQTMPILANVLIVARDNKLHLTATDLEVELVTTQALECEREGEITVPARKLLDICRALPPGAQVSLVHEGEKITLRSGRSRFTLSTLPASEFPAVDDINAQQTVRLAQTEAHRLLDKTHFSMAQQDVRYYLNGLLLETHDGVLRGVATDGHRLALCDVQLAEPSTLAQQVIVPRKGVVELQRLLGEEGEITIAIGSNHIRVELDHTRFTSKLIDGRFPDYDRVIPDTTDAGKLLADRELLRHALQRTAILSNEKYRGIRLEIKQDAATIQANNPEHEEAEEEVEVSYGGQELEIGFNVNYLLDALGAVEGEQVQLNFIDSNSSCLIREPDGESYRYVVMPMRL